jgi:hypothetical protein
MIQRIQTLFLLASAVVLGLLFWIPLATSNRPSVQFLSDSVFNIMDHPALIALTCLGIIVSLVAIFLYRKRPVQLKAGYFIIMVSILLPVISFILFTNASAQAGDVEIYDKPGLYLPAGSIVLTAIANYFIRKDEKLVKSMDRLR